jgi:hypothetical protein
MKVLNICASLLVLATTFASVAHAADKPEIKAKVALKESASWDGTPYESYPKGQPQLTIRAQSFCALADSTGVTPGPVPVAATVGCATNMLPAATASAIANTAAMP